MSSKTQEQTFLHFFFKKVLTRLYKDYIMTPSTGGKPETQNKRKTTNRKVKTMNTIDAIKDVAEEIIAETAQFVRDFGTNHHLAEYQWTEAWTKLTATAKEAEAAHGLLTGADLAELCNIAARLHDAIYGVSATVNVYWLADDQEGESVEVDYAEAERGYMECYMVRDLFPERDDLYGKRIDRGSNLMHLLADMVHMPAGMDDNDGYRETLELDWAK